MTRITQRPSVAPLGVFSQATSTSAGTGYLDPSFVTYVGQKFDTSDGRELTLVSNGAVALVSGVLVQGSPIVANHQNLAVAVPTATPATAGTFQISVTLGATKLTQNQYQGGFAIVNAGTGIGQALRISTNPGAASSGAGVIITLEDPIQVTLDATSKVSLMANPYQGCVISPTTSTGRVVGVTLYPVAAATAVTSDANGVITSAGIQQYALIVNKGITSCLSDVTVAGAGLGIMPSTTTAGSITVQAATGANIGSTFLLGVTAESRAVYIDC